MDTVSNYLKENPIETRGLTGITDPAVMNRTLNEMHRNAYRSGGFVSPTMGVTVEDADVDLPHAEYMELLHDEVLSTAGPSAFDSTSGEYSQKRFDYISGQTPMSASVRRDSLNRRIIGYGFNLESPENFALAAGVLNMSPEEVEAIRSGDAIITQAQARSLYEAQVSEADKLISERTEDAPLRANQRMVLTAMAIHNPELIGPKLSEALKNGNASAAVHEIKNRSNAAGSRELRLRRVQDAQHFSSYMTDEQVESGDLNELVHPSAVTRSKRPQARPDRGMPTSLRPQMRPTPAAPESVYDKDAITTTPLVPGTGKTLDEIIGSGSAPETSIRPQARPQSSAPETSIRPQARPTSAPETSIRPQARPDRGMQTSLRPRMRPNADEDLSSNESWWGKLANIFDSDEPISSSLPTIEPLDIRRPGIDTSRPISEQVDLKNGGWLERAYENPADIGTAFIEGARETLEGVKSGLVSAKDSTVEKMNEMAEFFNDTRDNVGFAEFTQFAKNYFIPGQTVTAENFDEAELTYMAELINEGIAAGRTSAKYINQDSSEGEAMSGGVLGGIVDPKIRIRRTLGAFNFRDNGDGTATVFDTYNFNADPVHGMPNRQKYLDAINDGDADRAVGILHKYWKKKEYVAIASIFAYVRQERLREAGKPFETPVEIIVPIQ